jgi:hypothetical protein
MDAIENASAPSAQNPFVTLGDLQNNTTELSLEGDVTGYSQYEDGVLVIYTEIAGQVPGIAGADFTKVFLTSESRALYYLEMLLIFL